MPDTARPSSADLTGLPDSYRAYADAVGRVPTPTHEQNLAWSRRVRRGAAAGARLAGRAEGGVRAPLPDAERCELEAVRADGLRARTAMIEANLRLVLAQAMKQPGGPGDLLADLVQEGNLGLMRAVDRFDPESGYRFSTYAVLWIRDAMATARSYETVVRVPNRARTELRRVRAVRDRLASDLRRDPTSTEIADAAGVPSERVDRLLLSSTAPLSIEVPSTELFGALLDPDSDPAVTVVDADTRGADRRALEAALDQLDPRLSRVLRLRFGLDVPPASLSAVASALGVSKRTVIGLESAALDELRRVCTARGWGASA